MPPTRTGHPWEDYFGFKHSQRERALPKSHGIKCPHCYGIHPYKGPHQLGFGFRHSDGRLTIIWTCPYSGDILEEVSYVPTTDYT